MGKVANKERLLKTIVHMYVCICAHECSVPRGEKVPSPGAHRCLYGYRVYGYRVYGYRCWNHTQSL